MTDPLQLLRERFLARARGDLAAVEAHLAGETLAFDNLRLLVHRLAGAGGTFGYLDISEAAGTAEDRLLTDGDLEPALIELRDTLARYATSPDG
ncbi:MAG: Hpt domain-containing protein [Caulobacteraceae bacterium]|nr:Hpt domain-containing protein [Caulobacteraceae bacterium]